MEKTERIRHIVLWRIRFVFLKLFKNRTSLPWEMRTENRTFVNIYFCSLIKEVGDCQAFNKLEVLYEDDTIYEDDMTLNIPLEPLHD